VPGYARYRLTKGRAHCPPPFLRVLLHPSWSGKLGRVLSACFGQHLAGRVHSQHFYP